MDVAAPHSSLTDGWQNPMKFGHQRNPLTHRPSGPTFSVVDQGEGSKREACRLGGSVPPLAETVSGPAAETESLGFETTLILDVNPFALLGSNRWAGRPKARKDANPRPSKRAQPGESHTQHVVSKPSKRKGKVLLSGSESSQHNFTFSASNETSKGPDSQAGTGPMHTRSRGKNPTGEGFGTTQLSQVEG